MIINKIDFFLDFFGLDFDLKLLPPSSAAGCLLGGEGLLLGISWCFYPLAF